VDGERKRIVVNGGTRTVSVETGRPLLFGLMSEGVFIPSACGGRGQCGQCRVYIKGSALPHTDAERLLVSESDRRFGIHLSCQVRARGDLSIEIPWKHFAARQYTARVAGLRDLTWEIKEVTLEVSGGFSFVAGQYIQVFLPGTESAPEPLYRAYSMASTPSTPQRLMLMVRRNPDGVVSPYLCDRLRQGEELAIRGPFGDFCLHDSTREVLFIAGGSGLAPIRSMLLTMAEKAREGLPIRTATLYFSGRSRRDLFLMDELSALAGALKVRFIPCLSNPLPDEPWDGERGGMPAVLDRRLDRMDNHEAYLCGSAGMIDACVKVLLSKGLAEELIFFDKFL
jgi:Na+-transporting NADH:ubiquinone oxidoreductase subunit F